MQKAVIVSSEGRYYSTNAGTSLNELNDMLKQGWKVVTTCPMPSSTSESSHNTVYPTCLVILEKAI